MEGSLCASVSLRASSDLFGIHLDSFLNLVTLNSQHGRLGKVSWSSHPEFSYLQTARTGLEDAHPLEQHSARSLECPFERHTGHLLNCPLTPVDRTRSRRAGLDPSGWVDGQGTFPQQRQKTFKAQSCSPTWPSPAGAGERQPTRGLGWDGVGVGRPDSLQAVQERGPREVLRDLPSAPRWVSSPALLAPACSCLPRSFLSSPPAVQRRKEWEPAAAPASSWPRTLN